MMNSGYAKTVKHDANLTIFLNIIKYTIMHESEFSVKSNYESYQII